MATRVRPTNQCEDANTQLKVLSARVKTMERQMAKMSALTQLMNIKNVAMMLLSNAPNKVAAAALLSADPTLLLSIAGAASEAALLSAIPGDAFHVFNGNLTLANLTLPAFGGIPGFPTPNPGTPEGLQDLLASCGSLSIHLS
jgi:hypothetical protein